MKLTPEQKRILRIIYNQYPDYAPNYSYLERYTSRTKKELQKDIKILKEWGLVIAVKGLMTDDGEVAGSGFEINYRAIDSVRAILEQKEEPQTLYTISTLLFKTREDAIEQLEIWQKNGTIKKGSMLLSVVKAELPVFGMKATAEIQDMVESEVLKV